MFETVLVANRGAIACRIIRTLQRMGVRAVAVYTAADAGSLHVARADCAIQIGDGPAATSYLDARAILEAAAAAGADAIHPGYGFLSENAEFAQTCADAGIVFIGPSVAHLRDFGLKHTARALASGLGVPMLPGSELLEDAESAALEAGRVGYPVILKSTAGGGGIGMRVCNSEGELREAFGAVTHLAASAFKQSGVYLERYVAVARHVEVQIFGDGRGNVVVLGERDCSAQRRNQKVIEETPAPGLPETQRQELYQSALALGRAVGYVSAGTVEFVFDVSTLGFYFLEVNTRLQVEHGVTEEVTGVDLVEWMVRAAAGELDLSGWSAAPRGASIQARVYAEDPNHDFRPHSGMLTEVVFPASDARVETWVEAGVEVTPFYDPMLAKIIVKADTREAAVAKLCAALQHTRLAGIETNVEYLRQLAGSPEFGRAEVHTRWLASFPYAPRTVDVLDAGTQSSVQDYPGRVGYWAVGVPPSGPMDELAHRVANALVGNPEQAAALEIAIQGPTLRFNTDAVVALCGADFGAELDGERVPMWQAVRVRAGSVLAVGRVGSRGSRAALAVRGGLNVPLYLGSRSTFALGKFGGHGGRTVCAGDVLHVLAAGERDGEAGGAGAGAGAGGAVARALHPSLQPSLAVAECKWPLRVLYGPHGAPDFLTEAAVETLFSACYKVHYNSNRLGIRLSGPRPEFARPDGGEAGLHPSNIHDTEYAIGSVNLTGEMPIILAKDGPSLGGFVCPVTVIKADLWKVGQLRPGDAVRFVRVTYEEAVEAERVLDAVVAAAGAEGAEEQARLASQVLERALGGGAVVGGAVGTPWHDFVRPGTRPEPAVVHELEAVEATGGSGGGGGGGRPSATYRMAGDKYLLVEYGPMVLDLTLRFRVHALMEWFAANPLPGVLELSPGVRSLQVNYDSQRLGVRALVDVLLRAERELPEPRSQRVPSRVLRLPLAFNASSTKEAIAKYRRSVRDAAPWLPSNVEFIRRVNGLDREEDVARTMFEAEYMVLGLGDVYLGAPCAVPVDPRHRLVTTKYNPARTWTAEGETGIGGVYMCIYGMESPGGYQLVGRTVPVWNKFRVTADFEAGKPWLLRYFDRVRFYPMEEAELLTYRAAVAHGQAKLDVTVEEFSVADYLDRLDRNAGAIAAFKERQTRAFTEERERWAADGSSGLEATEPPPTPVVDEDAIPAGATKVLSPIAANVWTVLVAEGDEVEAGQRLVVLEAMKTEVVVAAPLAGTVTHLAAVAGCMVTAGHALAAIVPRAAGAE